MTIEETACSQTIINQFPQNHCHVLEWVLKVMTNNILWAIYYWSKVEDGIPLQQDRKLFTTFMFQLIYTFLKEIACFAYFLNLHGRNAIWAALSVYVHYIWINNIHYFHGGWTFFFGVMKYQMWAGFVSVYKYQR